MLFAWITQEGIKEKGTTRRERKDRQDSLQCVNEVCVLPIISFVALRCLRHRRRRRRHPGTIRAKSCMPSTPSTRTWTKNMWTKRKERIETQLGKWSSTGTPTAACSAIRTSQQGYLYGVILDNKTLRNIYVYTGCARSPWTVSRGYISGTHGTTETAWVPKNAPHP
jgi:hypothetical protein